MKKSRNVVRRKFKFTVEFECEGDYILGYKLPHDESELVNKIEKAVMSCSFIEAMRYTDIETSSSSQDLVYVEDIT